jgi:hypothetical protein
MSTTTSAPRSSTCTHTPACATADSPARDSARVVSRHPEQGWSLLCNGVIAFDDGGDILPGGGVIAPSAYVPAPRRSSLGRAV